jgi:hypothetical protein
MPDNQPVHLLHPELQSLLVHWFLACAGRAMPRKRDLPLKALAAWRGNLAVIVPAAFGEPARYHFAFCGDGLAGRFGRLMSCRPLREIGEPLRDRLRATLESVRHAAAPAIARAEIARGDGTAAMWCDLVLPLSDSGACADRLVFASYAPEMAAGTVVAFPAPRKTQMRRVNVR